MSATGEWNHEIDVSDSDNITGLRLNLNSYLAHFPFEPLDTIYYVLKIINFSSTSQDVYI